MAKRMTILDYGQTVFLEYDCPYSSSRRYYTFWVPYSGGYVRRINATHLGTSGAQVCERLSSSGNTLWSTPENLVSVIRREYRKMRRQVEAERGS